MKVLDFGLAKRAKPGGGGHARQSTVAGTPQYMAPEQARGLDIGPPADLYAVGCIAFELLTGRLPFDGAQPIEIALKHINDPIPAASSLVSELPAEIDEFVSRLLAKDPSKRYPSAGAARRELLSAWNKRAWAATSKVTPIRREPARAETPKRPYPLGRGGGTPLRSPPARSALACSRSSLSRGSLEGGRRRPSRPRPRREPRRSTSRSTPSPSPAATKRHSTRIRRRWTHRLRTRRRSGCHC